MDKKKYVSSIFYGLYIYEISKPQKFWFSSKGRDGGGGGGGGGGPWKLTRFALFC